MEKLIENDFLLAEFAKAIYQDIEQDINNYESEKSHKKDENKNGENKYEIK